MSLIPPHTLSRHIYNVDRGVIAVDTTHPDTRFLWVFTHTSELLGSEGSSLALWCLSKSFFCLSLYCLSFSTKLVRCGQLGINDSLVYRTSVLSCLPLKALQGIGYIIVVV